MKNRIILLSGVMLLAMIASVTLGTAPRGLADALAAPNPPASLPSAPGAALPAEAGSPASAATPQAASLAGPMRLKGTLHPGAFYIDYAYGSSNLSTILDPKTYPVQGAFAHIKWYDLQSGPTTFNWDYLHYWINTRVSQGLNTGIMIDPYDGKYDGDSRALPDFVISTPGAMVVVPDSIPEQNRFVNYFDKVWNGGFDCPSSRCPGAPLGNNWTLSGNASLTTDVPPVGDGYAARLGGTDNAAGQVTSWDMRIPAMPPELTTDKMRLSFSVAMTTTDPVSDTDHLYVELVDRSHGNAVTTLREITNSSMVSNTWQWVGPIDVSGFVGRRVQIRLRATTDSANPTMFYVDDVTMQVRMLIPKYWGDPYKNAYRAFVQALGNEFKTDPGLDFVAMGMGLSGETQPANGDLYNSVLSGPPNNLTSGMWSATVNSFTDYYVSAFSAGTLQKSLLIQYAPVYQYASETLAETDWAAKHGAGLSHNGLMPDWVAVFNDSFTGVYDPLVSWNNYVPIAFESYPFYLCSPVATYWALLNGLDKHTDYMRIDQGLLTGSNGAANKPFFDWAKNYWGRTPDNTPSVWTVMREHRNPMEMCHAPTTPYYATGSNSQSYPQLGNYNFWMTQDDTIPHGRSVPETNDKGADRRYAKNPVNGTPYADAGLGNCPANNRYASTFPANYPCNREPYNPNLPALGGANPNNFYDPSPLTGAGKEAWVIRRTAQTSAAQDYLMGFNIDPSYMDGSLGQVYSATVTVTYLDMGTDAWSLWYDSTSGDKMAPAPGSVDGYVHKQNTKTFKQAKFVLGDAKFANRMVGGKADFYIDSRGPGNTNDGDEWIHMADVAKGSASAEPTPTPTQTNTPTVTPTATPSTGAVVGTAFSDLNASGVRDAGEPGLAGAVMVLRPHLSGGTTYTTTSGLDGSYRLDGVSPAQYQLLEVAPPVGYQRWPDSGMNIFVQANSPLTFDVPHGVGPTATPTATGTQTPTATPTAMDLPQHGYLPLLLSQ